jgi:hypothetical protein
MSVTSELQKPANRFSPGIYTKDHNWKKEISLTLIRSRVWVTIDGVWTSNRIYWALQHTTRDYTLQTNITVSHASQITIGLTRSFQSVTVFIANHSGRAVWTMNCLCLLERWDRGFESQSRHGYIRVRLFCVCVVLCVGCGLATGRSLVQGVLPSV